MLFAKSRNRLWEFCDPLLSAFWRREFDLESPAEIEVALINAGLQASEWREYLEHRAQCDLDDALKRAELLGVFGAPTFVYRGELFWGGDRIDLLAENIHASATAACSQ